MNITPHDLALQFYRARSSWPFFDAVEAAHGLPRCLLYAVGSRETNLTNERGDGGHGWGIFQLDDRSHTIPPGYLDDVRRQANDAADHLAGGYARYGDWTKALNAYNSGQTLTERTAHGDYGPDVLARARFLADLASPLPPDPNPDPQPVVEDDMPLQATDPTNGDFWLCDPSNGSVDSFDRQGNPHNRYYGGANSHPEWNVGAGRPLGAVVGFAYWPDDPEPDKFGRKGYLMVSRAADGFHTYRFRGSGADAKVFA